MNNETPPVRRRTRRAAQMQPPEQTPMHEEQPQPQKPQPPKATTKKRKKKKKRGALMALLLILLLLLAIGFMGVWYHFIRDDGQYERYQFDTDAIAGRIQQMTEEEIQAEMDRVIEEGMFNISIASAIVFDGPDKPGKANIENIAANRYHMQVDLFLDETGEKIYASKLIRPGYAIEHITLDTPLEPGEYRATAIFSAITQEELQLFGQAGAQVKLYVLDEEGKIPTRVQPMATPALDPTASPAP